MSYLRRLDQARAHLGEGDLLAAERELREATQEWKASRLRAPLLEKGLEPALRTIGRVFGRRSDEPVLPNFSRRAELLREDLHAYARSLVAEVLEDIAREDLDPRRRHAQLTEALTLQRSSEFFRLTPAREWDVVKVWLADCRRLGSGVRAELLPSGAARAGDQGWWLEWLEAWCVDPIEPVRAFAGWARKLAWHYGELEEVPTARWAWVHARLAMLDPQSAPVALASVERVLDRDPEPALASAALVTWAELVTNYRLLAAPGGNARDLLDARSMEAARLGVAWPPATIATRLPERRPSGGSPAFVAVSAQDGGTAIALVLHDGRSACDVLCIKPSADPDPADEFSMSDGEAQRRIAAWLPPDAVLLSAGEPGPRLRGLVGSARWVPVQSLLDLFGGSRVEAAPAAPVSAHPAWTREICAPWDALVPSARRLLPALERLFADWPTLATGWGRENLRRLGERGVVLAEALAAAAGLAGPAAHRADRLVEASPPLALAWPRLVDRPWPDRLANGDGTGVRATPGAGCGRQWVDRKADALELASASAGAAATSLLCVGESRLFELARAATAITDPVRVAAVGPPVPCVRPLLDLLNRWVSESPGDLERGRAAVWLLTVLSECAGPLEPLLARCTSDALVQEARSCIEPCTGDCTGPASVDCWPRQAAERVAASHIAVVDLGASEWSLPPDRLTVADDLREWVCGVDDPEALRRLGALPPDPEPVMVFTPGIGFLASVLGYIPGVDGSDGGWNFRPESTAAFPAVWTAPRGYGPASVVLAREARALVEERVRRWTADLGSAPVWGEAPEDAGPGLQGVATEPEHDSVLVCALGDQRLDSVLLMGLRLASAASHARERVVCLTPALAEELAVGGGLLHGEDEATVPRALDSGSILLADRRGRSPASWTSPLTRPRLERIGAARAREVAGALQRWGPGRGRVLAGAPESDRDAVVELLRRLQEESLDGGPLGIRFVVVVGPETVLHEGGEAPGLRLRALDRGRHLVARIAVDELGDAAVEDWARRTREAAWVFRNAEALLPGERQGAVGRILVALRRSQARALFFTDHVSDARRLKATSSRHLALDAVSVIEELPTGLDPGPWETRSLGALQAQCPGCARSVVYHAAYELCPDCGTPVDSAAPVRRSLRIAFESRVVETLRQLGPQATWSLLVFDRGRQSRLRQRLGLDGAGLEDSPLLRGASARPSAEVLLPVDLWRAEPVLGPMIICGLPASVEEWESIAGRLIARAVPAGQWWLGPAGLDESEPLPAADVELRVGRDDFVEHLAGGGDRVAAMSTVRRLEAAGGSWGGDSVLRVHELVGSGHSDDAALAALVSASSRGWTADGTVVGLGASPVARVERAVRTGVRLREPPATAAVAEAPREGVIVGVGGWGKTTALLRIASVAASQRRSVLVLLPSDIARLEWMELLGDPGVACLGFDEFLIWILEGADAESRLRVLPPADRGHGEEVRLTLSRRVSELYAAECGELPAIDARSLVRALEGERMGPDPAGAHTNVDYTLLEACVDRAREEGGWTDARELLRRARALSVAGRVEAAASSFDVVIVDSAHDLPDGGLDYLRRVFGDHLRAHAVDPVLGFLPEADVRDEAMESRRFGPEIAGAIEQVWRATTPLPAPMKGRGPARGLAESERILALTTATERIAEELVALDPDGRVAIVAANERDRRMMEQQLGVRGVAVDGSDRDFAELVTGPREVLAALAWSADADPDASTELLQLVLAAGPEPEEREQADHYEARMRRRLDGESVEVLDRVEAFLLPLVLIRSALGPATRVDRAVEVLLGCGLLDRLRDQPGLMRRLEDFVRQYRGLRVAELLESVPVDRILRPASGGQRVEILAPDRLAGRSFDRVYYICTGLESPERHYRVLSRARSAVKIACSEVDPLQG